jgi:hypothetical protein
MHAGLIYRLLQFTEMQVQAFALQVVKMQTFPFKTELQVAIGFGK